MNVTATREPAPFAPLPSPTVEGEAGRFLADQSAPLESSRRKRIYRGTWCGTGDDRERNAVASVFLTADPACYGSEVATLARCQALGAGPRAFCLAGRTVVDGRTVPAIVIEDVGIDAEAAVFGGAVVPSGTGDAAFEAPLSAVGTPEREAESAKILFDVCTQVANLHRANIFHRDIRAANVCLRRFGPLPSDIRATLIDLELCTADRERTVPAAARRYERSLFERLPRAVAERNGRHAACCAPTPIERDLGYLAALRFELTRGISIEHATPEDLVSKDPYPFFSYDEDGTPRIRMIDRAVDTDPLAKRLGLDRVDADRFFDPSLLARMQAEIHHGGFVDACDRALIAEWGESRLAASVETVAREAVYPRWKAQVRAQGREPEYSCFDDQPALLQESNRAQARDIPAKLHALGYRIMDEQHVPEADRVRAFAPQEIEYLAYLEHRRWMDERLQAGWTWGPARDDVQRIHPDLVPYEELSEASKELDRSAVEGIIGILASVGLAVCR